MLRLGVEIEGATGAADAIGQLAERLGASPRDVLARIAEDWATRVFPAVIDRGLPGWPPLSLVSLRLRAGSRPLQGEGKLRAGFQVIELDDFEAAVANEYGAVHQRGGRTSPRSMIPDREIPARPFLVLDAAAIEESVAALVAFYFGEGA